jgi:hypothetical protein
MTSPGRRRRFHRIAGSCLFAVVVSARPGLASTLTFTAVHTSYQADATASATISDTITDTVNLRWDLVKIVQGTVLAGGTDVGSDAASHDTISLTGSGEAEPGEKEAGGGGTFVHKHRASGRRSDRRGGDKDEDAAEGEVEVHGVYVVTAFVDWQPAGGKLNVVDGIGQAAEASSGILTLKVRLLPSGGGHHDGVLTVHCRLPGSTFDIDEGITLAIDGFHFVQDEGRTLFHVQK